MGPTGLREVSDTGYHLGVGQGLLATMLSWAEAGGLGGGSVISSRALLRLLSEQRPWTPALTPACPPPTLGAPQAHETIYRLPAWGPTLLFPAGW